MLNYNQIKKHINGRWYSLEDISMLWNNYKIDEIKDNNKLYPVSSPTIPTNTPVISNDIIKINYLESKNFPKEIAWRVMTHMKLEDINNLCIINKYYYDEVCTDIFWRYYVEQKYGITEKYVYQNWRDIAQELMVTYDHIFYENKRKTKILYKYVVNFHKVLWFNYKFENEIPVVFVDSEYSPYDYTYSYPKKIELLSNEKIIDGYVHYDRRSIVIFLVDIYGQLYYNLGLHPMNYKLIPNIKAHKVTNGHIIQKNGDILVYELAYINTIHPTSEGELGLNIKQKPLIIPNKIKPIKIKYISDFNYILPNGQKSRHYNATYAIDINDRVWVKNRNFVNKITEKQTKFELLDLSIKIKKIISNGLITLFLDINENLWFMKINDHKPKKINNIYRKGKNTYVLKIIDFALIKGMVNIIAKDQFGENFVFEIKLLYNNEKQYKISKKKIKIDQNIVKYANQILDHQIFYSKNS